MCLAIPGKVISIDSAHTQVDIMGVLKEVNILLIDNPRVGDKVMVHAGFAINKIEDEYYNFLRDTLQNMLRDMP